ncbi:MAG: hypothetical protein ACJ77K_04645 [Bacteroidia bacterium]
MENEKTSSKASKVISMSESTKAKLSEVADKLKGRELFAKKIELAKKSLSEIKSLPI